MKNILVRGEIPTFTVLSRQNNTVSTSAVVSVVSKAGVMRNSLTPVTEGLSNKAHKVRVLASGLGFQSKSTIVGKLFLPFKVSINT